MVDPPAIAGGTDLLQVSIAYTSGVAQFSIESQWQSQAERRRRIIKFMLVVVLIFILLLIGLWFWVTQPMLTRVATSSERTVDPARLEAHVRKLSVELTPRDER